MKQGLKESTSDGLATLLGIDQDLERGGVLVEMEEERIKGEVE